MSSGPGSTSRHRRNLRNWTLSHHGNGATAPCAGCGITLDQETMTLDRFPIPGRFGGRYVRENVRPMCHPCNSSHVGEPGYEELAECRGLRYRPFELIAMTVFSERKLA